MSSTRSPASEQVGHMVMGMTPEQIKLMPWLPVASCPGVYLKELWRRGDLVHVLLRYDAGASTPGQPHHGAHQHIWVLGGEASIGGHHLAAGSYAHVPPGSPHPIRGIGPSGCVLLQTHVPDLPASPR